MNASGERGPYRAWARWFLAGLLALVCVAAVHLCAGRLGHDGTGTGTRAGGPSAEPADREQDVRAPHPPRTLTTRADFTVGSGTWRATVRHTLLLRPGDPLLTAIREGRAAAGAARLDDRLAGDVRYAAGEGLRTDGGTDRRLTAPEVTQDGPRERAVEWRPVARAGVQWRLVRSFRSWASLTAPVTAVVVAAATAVATVLAAATAVATALAGAAAVSMTQQPTDGGSLQQQSSYSSGP
ncbi:hypothetical protein [Streptomyces griseoruber]|uniref:Uncharacterized protein n=1 Tax=Streptomyces griseoruber TaxID=1943 RepID=A0A101SWD1_9ACTN|nr:hypothetical protein [Streptomyces griseoruber]KUN81415.1 hypothetical protein AQJ64_23855 [Streptomyces griseoruber]